MHYTLCIFNKLSTLETETPITFPKLFFRMCYNVTHKRIPSHRHIPLIDGNESLTFFFIAPYFTLMATKDGNSIKKRYSNET